MQYECTVSDDPNFEIRQLFSRKPVEVISYAYVIKRVLLWEIHFQRSREILSAVLRDFHIHIYGDSQCDALTFLRLRQCMLLTDLRTW